MRKRKYSINDNYFNSIDNEDKAYILGFLYADGCVKQYKNTKIITIELNTKDKDILYKIKQKLEYNKSDLIYTNKNSCILSFTSQQIFDDLVNKGCVPKKSLILNFPTAEMVPDYLLYAFVRGYFDGDGSFLINKTYTTPCVKIISSVQFVSKLCSVLENILHHKIYIDKHLTKTHTLVINQRFIVKEFLEFIYQKLTSNSLFLQRKYDKYIEATKNNLFTSKQCQTIQNIKSFKENIINDYINGLSTPILSIKYNCGDGAILKLLHDNKINVRPDIINQQKEKQ